MTAPAESESGPNGSTEQQAASGQSTKKRRRLNLPLLAASIVAVVIVVVGTPIVQRHQLHHTGQTLLKRAAQLEQDGSLREAAARVHDYLGLFPDDAKQRIRRATLYDRSAVDWRNTREQSRAVELFYQAIGTVADQEAIQLRRLLIPRLLQQSRRIEAANQANELLAHDPKDGAGLRWLAIAKYRMFKSSGDDRSPRSEGESIGAILAKAIEANRGDEMLAGYLADVYRNHSDLLSESQRQSVAERSAAASEEVEETRAHFADAVVAKMVRDANGGAASLLARYRYRTQYKLPGGDIDLDQALLAAPNDPEVLLAGAQRALRRSTVVGGVAREDHLREAESLFEKVAAELSPVPTDNSEDQIQRCRRAFIGSAQVSIAQNDFPAAMKTLERGLRAIDEDDVQLNVCVAEVAAVSGNEERAAEAQGRIDRFMREVGQSIHADLRLTIERSQTLIRGKQQIQNGQLVGAIRSLRQLCSGSLQTQHSDTLTLPAWILLATAHSRLGEWGDAAVAFEKAAAIQPNYPEHAKAAGEAWERANQLDRALEIYRKSSKETGDAQLWLALARTQLQIQRLLPATDRSWLPLERALEQTEATFRDQQVASKWQLALLRAETAAVRCAQLPSMESVGEELVTFTVGNNQSWRLRESHRDSLIDFFPGISVVSLCEELLATWRESDDLPDDINDLVNRLAARFAQAWLRQVESDYAGDLPFLLELAELYERLALPREADRLLASYRRLDEVSTSDRIRVAQVYRLRGDFETAEAVVNEGSEAADDDDFARVEFIAAVAHDRDTVESLKVAKKLLLDLLAVNPNDVNVTWRLAELAAADENANQEPVDWENRLKEIEGNDGYRWRIVRVARLLSELDRSPPNPDDPKAVEARELIGSLKRSRPEWSPTWVAEGQLNSHLLRLSDAVVSYRQAIKFRDVDITVYRELLALLYQQNQLEEASDLLAAIERLVPRDRGLARVAMSVWAASNQERRALALAQESIASDPNNAIAWVWHSQMLRLNGRTKEAEDAIQKAIALAPHDPRVLTSLFSFYIRNGQLDEARLTLTDLLASDTFRGEIEKILFEAQASQLLGEEKRAADLYRHVAMTDPENATVCAKAGAFFAPRDPMLAEQLLRRALEAEPFRASTRQTLAAVLMAQGTSAAWNEARNVLGDDDKSDVGRRLNAMLLLEKRQDVSIATEILEQLVTKSGNPADRFLLANVHLLESPLEFSRDKREGRLAEADAHYRVLASRKDAKPEHIKRYIDFLVRYRSEAEASEWLPLLREKLIEGGDSRTDGLVRFTTFLLDTGFQDATEQSLGEIQQTLRQGDSVNQGFFVDLCWRHGSIGRAERELALVEKAEPNSLSTIARRARFLYSTGDSEAIEALVDGFANRWLNVSTDKTQNRRLIATVGRLYASLDQDELAERWFRKLLELDPNDLLPLGNHYLGRRRIDSLTQLCRSAAGKRSEVWAATLLANGLSMNRKDAEGHPDSERLLEEVLARTTTDLRLLCAIGRVQQLKGRLDEAEALFQRALEIDDADGSANSGMAFVLARRSDRGSEAVVHATRALQSQGPTSELLAAKGMAFLLDGQPQESLDLLRAAAATVNADPVHQFYYALALSRCDEKETAAQKWHSIDHDGLMARISRADDGLLAGLRQILD